MRVHEIAKKTGLSSTVVKAELKKLGVTVKNHMSQVEEDVAAKLLKSPPKPAEKKPAAKKKAAAKTAAAPKAKKAKEPSKKPAAVAKKAVKSAAAPEVAVEVPAEETVEIPVPEQEKPKTKTEPPKLAVPARPPVSIRFPITVGSLAESLSMKVPELIKNLMAIGVFANINQLLNEEIVQKLARKLEMRIEKLVDEAEEIFDRDPKADKKKLKLRPPVVTMMGHVDHGKTSLLDAIRKTNVAAREKGAITQHIGAYGVDIPGKGHVTFIDTPGHEAFTAMRARGANATDVVVLVVAADDGVMPQTVEAIDHAREAGCPIVVAMNKSDLPNANPQRVMSGLQKLDLMPEEWGGKTICVKVSAKTGTGIDQLLEMLLLEAEVLELKANPDCPARGTVIESHISKGSGPVATIIVQEGTLRVGDMMVCGQYMGRVRAMRNDRGKTVKEASPSYAVEVSGLGGVPEAGEIFGVVEDEKTARRITEKRVLEARERQMRGASKHLSLEDLYEKISEGDFKELKLIIKVDVQGSAEALVHALEKLSTDRCQVRVIHCGVGGVNESDVMLAAASDAIIIGFHVKADTNALQVSEKEGVNMRFYNIIYEAAEDVRKAMEGLLEPTYKEVLEGKVEIRKVFQSSRFGNIAGGMVTKGKVLRTNPVRVIRGHVVIFDGKLSSLKRFKDDVRDVAQGYECGLVFNGFNEVREGDVVESYRLDKIAAKL